MRKIVISGPTPVQILDVTGPLEVFSSVSDYQVEIVSEHGSDQLITCFPFASHIHVRGGVPGRLQTSVDENTIDFSGMLAGLHGPGCKGFLALEYVWVDWKGCNRVDNLSETFLLRRVLESADLQLTAKG